MPSKPRAVLIIDDKSLLAQETQRALAGIGYDALAVGPSADQALTRAAKARPDIVLMDGDIQGRAERTRTAQLLQERYDIPVVYLAGRADHARLERARGTRPWGYVLKPVKPAELKSAIEDALERHDRGAGASAPPRATRPPAARAVRRQLEQILSNADFDASRRSREFLVFIVEEAIAGRGESLTQAAIATRVFDRRDDFDPVVDPIVRIQAGRLRRSLERYYLLSGKQDPLRIELPRGCYVPAFRDVPAPEAAPATRPEAAPAAQTEDWPAIVVSALEPAGPSPEDKALAHLVTEELILELGRYRDFRTLLRVQLEGLAPPVLNRQRFWLDGRLRLDDQGPMVVARLVDHATGEQVWGDTYHTQPKNGRWSGSPEDVARVVAARIAAEEGVLVQLLGSERRRMSPRPRTPFDAMLLAYEFFLARTPESLSASVTALQRAVEADPDCGPAWTRLARVFLNNHTFEVTSLPTPLEQAIAYAHHGVRLDPASRRARCVLAASLIAQGELLAARAELDEALRVSPDSLVYLEIIGFLLTVAGDWERGPAFSRSARERNPHALTHGLFGLWADHLRRGEFEAAYQAALEYRDPTVFWRSAMRACCLGHLGRPADAEVADLLRGKPDFEARGRTLIGYFVKFPELMDVVVDGLARAGVRLA